MVGRTEHVPCAAGRALADALGENEVVVEGRGGGDAQAVGVAVAVQHGEWDHVPRDLDVLVLVFSLCVRGEGGGVRLRFRRAHGCRWRWY